MSSNGCATGVKSDTGYSAPVIKYVWRKYRAQLINAARGCIHARNSPLVLDACMKLTVHLTNVGIKEPWMPSPCARYPGWGNHPHYP